MINTDWIKAMVTARSMPKRRGNRPSIVVNTAGEDGEIVMCPTTNSAGQKTYILATQKERGKDYGSNAKPEDGVKSGFGVLMDKESTKNLIHALTQILANMDDDE